VSSIVTEQGIVHYESYGSGSPVILLHGWLGSWGLWQPTMEALGRQYRCYAIDFWGFGDSGKKRDSYRVSDFVELVPQFMNALGIQSAPIVGHSMGGTTALGTAIRHPDYVRRVCVIGSPIAGSSLSLLLQLAGVPWIGSLVRNTPGVLLFGLKLYAPLVTRNPKTWYPMLERDVSKTTVASFFSSIGSLRRTDLRSQLPAVKMPVTGIYGQRDVIVHPKQYVPLQRGVPQAQVAIMPRSGHFPMLDEPDQYLTHIKTFLSQNGSN
jgi:pimeloyl-ACP methyl ester carboxylesterase